MLKKLCEKRNKRGFTLAELLIVVAIIAILVAIAIPTFTSQLDKARKAVDLANARAGSSLAVADYQLSGKTEIAIYKVVLDENQNLTVSTATDATAIKGQSSTYKNIYLQIQVEGGEVTKHAWGALFGGTDATFTS